MLESDCAYARMLGEGAHTLTDTAHVVLTARSTLRSKAH
jgi:hypothetical protein